jgi:hypothetical protein
VHAEVLKGGVIKNLEPDDPACVHLAQMVNFRRGQMQDWPREKAEAGLIAEAIRILCERLPAQQQHYRAEAEHLEGKGWTEAAGNARADVDALEKLAAAALEARKRGLPLAAHVQEMAPFKDWLHCESPPAAHTQESEPPPPDTPPDITVEMQRRRERNPYAGQPGQPDYIDRIVPMSAPVNGYVDFCDELEAAFDELLGEHLKGAKPEARVIARRGFANWAISHITSQSRKPSSYKMALKRKKKRRAAHAQTTRQAP